MTPLPRSTPQPAEAVAPVDKKALAGRSLLKRPTNSGASVSQERIIPPMSKPARVATLPTLLTMEDAAAHLGVTTTTVRNWIASGALPAYRLGSKAIRVRESDVEALLRPI